MSIASVSFGKLPPLYREGIKIDYKKPNGGIPEDVPDDAVVAYGSQDNNYRFPIYAGQIRVESARVSAQHAAAKSYGHKETPEEYYARKVNSTEWCL